MKLRYIYGAIVAAAIATASLLSSCGNDSKWAPGEDIDPNNMSLYFEQLSSYKMLLGPDDSRIIPVTVSRSRFDQAASVPVTLVEAPEGVSVSPTADFAAGEQSTTIFVNAESMADKVTGNIVLSLPADMVSPYGAGTPSLTFAVTTAGSWMPLDTNVAVTFSQKYADMTASLYVLDGTLTFKIPNFLGSGLDFVFNLKDDVQSATKIRPVRNFMLTDDYYGKDYDYPGWMFYDDKAADYPEWAPDGGSLKLTWVEFDYEYVDFNFSEGTMTLSPYVYFNDGSSAYLDIDFTFTPAFNPFVKE